MASVVASLDWKGKRTATRGREGAVRGLRAAGEHLLGVSRDLAPLEEGTLRASGESHVDPGSLTAAVSYGRGGAEDYAVVQHERTDFDHPLDGQAKYLEEPFYGEMSTMRRILADELRKGLR